MGSESPTADLDNEEKSEAAAAADSEDEENAERERGVQYLDFRRKFDAMKAEVAGQQSKAESLKSQGNSLFSFGCFAQAAIMYSEAIELQPKNAVLYCNRSMAYLKQDMPDEALADAEKSMELDSSVENVKAYWRKAQALLDLCRYDDAEAAADEGIALQPSNNHLNKVRRKAREAKVVKQLGAGKWVGKQNGVERKMIFHENGRISMTVFGVKVGATYDLSVEGQPWSMVVKMTSMPTGPGTGPPPPPVAYIFEFKNDGEELWLCHSMGGGRDEGLPSKFEGPGFLSMKLQPVVEDAVEETHEPLDVRCIRYMREMNKVMPEVPPQLPEKPSYEQVEDEIRVTAAISELKRRYGQDVNRRAVALAKDPVGAAAGNPTLTIEEREELTRLAQEFRRRLLTRKLIAPEELVEDPCGQPVPAVGSDLLHVGAEVQIRGLTGALELNGARGKLLKFDAETGRWAVELNSNDPTLQEAGDAGKVKRVRAENLRLFTPHAAAQSRSARGTGCFAEGAPLACLGKIAAKLCSSQKGA